MPDAPPAPATTPPSTPDGVAVVPPGPSATTVRRRRTGFLRRTWDDTPLRARLVIGLMLVVAVTLTGIGVGTFVVLKRYLLSQLDDSLTPLSNPDAAQTAYNWYQQGISSVVVYPDGSVRDFGLTKNGRISLEARTDDSAVLAMVPTDGVPRTIHLDSVGDVRVVAVTRQLSFGEPSNLSFPVSSIAVEPLSKLDSTTERLLLLQVAGLGLALLVVGVAGSWWIRRSMRPLRRVADTAGAVARLPLERGDVELPPRVSNDNPNTEVGQLGSAVNAMLDNVEVSLRARQASEDRLRRFVSDAGHELRTPLATVRGYAELVRRAGPDHPDQALASAARIESAAARMGMLVDDLLLLASLDEGRPLQHERVDLAQLANEAVTEAVTRHQEQRFFVNAPEEAVVEGDGLRLHQVVGNLLTNAGTYTPAFTNITTSVSCEGDLVVLEVRDDGPGIADDLLPRVTERFTRGDSSRSRATGGSGLGLSIARAIVERHGGTLTVRNDGGAVVRVELPASRP